MNKFLQDLKVALGVAYLNDVKANRVFRQST